MVRKQQLRLRMKILLDIGHCETNKAVKKIFYKKKIICSFFVAVIRKQINKIGKIFGRKLNVNKQYI
jgi:hypothetical protein